MRTQIGLRDLIVGILLSKKHELDFETISANTIIEHLVSEGNLSIKPIKDLKPDERSHTNEIHHCGNELTEKEVWHDHCLQCGEYLQEDEDD